MIPVVQHVHSALGTDRDGHRKFGLAAKVEIVPVAEFPALVLGNLSLFGRVVNKRPKFETLYFLCPALTSKLFCSNRLGTETNCTLLALRRVSREPLVSRYRRPKQHVFREIAPSFSPSHPPEKTRPPAPSR
jgi:hypothetical protein